MFAERLNPDVHLRMDLPSTIATHITPPGAHIFIESEVLYPCSPESSKKSE